MRLRNLFGSHTSSRRSCSTAGARRCGRTTRRLAVEALEQRTLLSVGPVAEFSATVQPNDPATLEASAMVAATAPEGEVVHGPLRVGVWTEELIGNLGDWVENQTWPDVFGHGA
ncbi:MAG: hypothetical protein HQ567_15415, partial [Candidatus Nealsonbacteria bacterium]|nr:hypothetical protein [Candidatus Nealsonbacteria bacterium]